MTLTKEHKKLLNEILMQPTTTIRTVKIRGEDHLERRFIEGTRIIIERIKLRGNPHSI